MSTDNLEKNNTAFTEEESGFDIKEWIFHFLRFWYLFLIGAFIALGISYLKNRSWLPQYQTAGTMVISSSSGGSGAGSVMQGFGIQSGMRNLNNQIIMLRSYDLLGRVVDSLPFFNIDYISQGRFRTRNLYNQSPIYITTDYLSAEAYNYLYKINISSDGTYTINLDSDKNPNSHFPINGTLGEKLQHELFSIAIGNNVSINKDIEIYFRFRTKESLVNEFYYRLGFGYVEEGASILKVSLVGEVPQRDIDFINKLCDVFISDNLGMKNNTARKTIDFIDGQLDVLLSSLSVSEGEMTEFRQKNQIVDVTSYISTILSKATEYDVKQRNLELRETYFNYLVDYLNKTTQNGSVIAPSAMGVNEPMLVGLISQINTKFLALSELSEKNPFYEKTQKEIDVLKETIFELISSMRLSLNIEKEDVARRLKDVDDAIHNLPEKELEMIAIERRYRIDDTYYTFFLQKRAEAEIQRASNEADNTILDRARIMALTNGDAKSKRMMTYLLMGIFIPFAFVLLLKLLNTKVNTIKEVEKNSSFPIIGSIRKTEYTDPMLSIKKPRSSFTEMFRVIRTRIEFIVQRKSNIMITISSAESGDGKTYFSANLAAIYAMTQKKTLLIDMDIRKPNIYKLFDIPNEPGLTNYLIGEKSLLDVIQHTENPYYDVMTVGTVPPNPGEIVRSERLRDVLDELKKEYEYIIVDTSPIGLVADAYSITMISDVNLFVTRMGKTQKTAIKKITEQLKEDRLPNVYVVVNDVPAGNNLYGKYNSYSHGYYYGYGNEKKAKYRFMSKKKKEAARNHAKYYSDDKDL